MGAGRRRPVHRVARRAPGGQGEGEAKASDLTVRAEGEVQAGCRAPGASSGGVPRAGRGARGFGPANGAGRGFCRDVGVSIKSRGAIRPRAAGSVWGTGGKDATGQQSEHLGSFKVSTDVAGDPAHVGHELAHERPEGPERVRVQVRLEGLECPPRLRHRRRRVRQTALNVDSIGRSNPTSLSAWRRRPAPLSDRTGDLRDGWDLGSWRELRDGWDLGSWREAHPPHKRTGPGWVLRGVAGRRRVARVPAKPPSRRRDSPPPTT